MLQKWRAATSEAALAGGSLVLNHLQQVMLDGREPNLEELRAALLHAFSP